MIPPTRQQSYPPSLSASQRSGPTSAAFFLAWNEVVRFVPTTCLIGYRCEGGSLGCTANVLSFLKPFYRWRPISLWVAAATSRKALSSKKHVIQLANYKHKLCKGLIIQRILAAQAGRQVDARATYQIGRNLIRVCPPLSSPSLNSPISYRLLTLPLSHSPSPLLANIAHCQYPLALPVDITNCHCLLQYVFNSYPNKNQK